MRIHLSHLLKTAFLIVTTVCLSVIITKELTTKSDIMARSFTLVDNSGRRRLEIKTDRDGGVRLSMYDLQAQHGNKSENAMNIAVGKNGEGRIEMINQYNSTVIENGLNGAMISMNHEKSHSSYKISMNNNKDDFLHGLFVMKGPNTYYRMKLSGDNAESSIGNSITNNFINIKVSKAENSVDQYINGTKRISTDSNDGNSSGIALYDSKEQAKQTIAVTEKSCQHTILSNDQKRFMTMGFGDDKERSIGFFKISDILSDESSFDIEDDPKFGVGLVMKHEKSGGKLVLMSYKNDFSGLSVRRDGKLRIKIGLIKDLSSIQLLDQSSDHAIGLNNDGENSSILINRQNNTIYAVNVNKNGEIELVPKSNNINK